MIVCGTEPQIEFNQLPLVQSDDRSEETEPTTPERLRQRLQMVGESSGSSISSSDDESSIIISNNINEDDTTSSNSNDDNNNTITTTSIKTTTTEASDDSSHHQQRFAVLSFEQASKLDKVMEEVMPIHGRGNFPTLEVRLKDLVRVVRGKLEGEQSVRVRDIRLNGGAASHVLATPEGSSSITYNDLDLIFAVDLSNSRNFDKIRTAVLDSLLDFLPEGVVKKRISTCSLKEAYVHKMVKVTNGDRWSLISLSNNRGRNIELKFVDTMRRQFEFSVDSFQIVLDSLLLFYGCSQVTMSDNFYPTVVAESVYGDFQEALYHLHKKLIATRNPEEIRGGGLLKYCNLLVRDYKPSRPEKIKHLERYMCSRFFIDFGDIHQQRSKLESYLANHFMGEEQNKYEYLLVLHRVVDESTVCLMGHERRQSLALIEELACRTYYFEHQAKDIFQPHPHIVFGGGFFFTPYAAPYPCQCSWMPCT